MSDKKEFLRQKYDELVNENPDVKEWLDHICRGNRTVKQEMRRATAICVIFILAIAIIFWRISKNTERMMDFSIRIARSIKPIHIVIGYVVSFVIIIILVKIFSSKPSKKKAYREKVEIPLIKMGCDLEELDDKKGIPSTVYRKAGFREEYNSYATLGYMKAKRDNLEIELAKVITEYEEESEDEETVYTFEGIVIVGTLNENITNGYIKIFSDRDDKRRMGYSGQNEKIHMDSLEFEQHFDVYSDDPIGALKLLTTNVMQELIEIKQKYNWIYDITITGKNIIVRFTVRYPTLLLNFRVNQFEDLQKRQTIKECLVYDIDLVSNMIDFTEKISKYINN